MLSLSQRERGNLTTRWDGLKFRGRVQIFLALSHVRRNLLLVLSAEYMSEQEPAGRNGLQRVIANSQPLLPVPSSVPAGSCNNKLGHKFGYEFGG